MLSNKRNEERFKQKFSNNPYIILENTWKDLNANTSNVNNSFNKQIMANSEKNDHPTNKKSSAESINLSSLYMSTIFMLEDKHIPSILIRMYEFSLTMANETPDDMENNSRLRLINYILQKWHETREKLIFVRDSCRVIGAMSKRLFKDHLSIAIENTKIEQQHVFREVMRTLKKESRGMSIGEFLDQFRGSEKSNLGFNALNFQLFDKEEALNYEQYEPNSWSFRNIMMGQFLDGPIFSYSKRILITILRNYCRLNMNMQDSISKRLFDESVPSWAEEDTETGVINIDDDTREKVKLARENITKMLLKRSNSNVEKKIENYEDEDVNTIDTRSFLNDYDNSFKTSETQKKMKLNKMYEEDEEIKRNQKNEKFYIDLINDTELSSDDKNRKKIVIDENENMKKHTNNTETIEKIERNEEITSLEPEKNIQISLKERNNSMMLTEKMKEYKMTENLLFDELNKKKTKNEEKQEEKEEDNIEPNEMVKQKNRENNDTIRNILDKDYTLNALKSPDEDFLLDKNDEIYDVNNDEDEFVDEEEEEYEEEEEEYDDDDDDDENMEQEEEDNEEEKNN